MGDLIIKPASSGSLKIQDQAGTNFITTGTSSGLTLDSGVTFPAGHIIKVEQATLTTASSVTLNTTFADISKTTIEHLFNILVIVFYSIAGNYHSMWHKT